MNFSPGLKPIKLILHFGAIAFASSKILYDGSLGTNISPPKGFLLQIEPALYYLQG